MTSPIKLLADRGLLWMCEENVVAHVDSIPLVSIPESHDDFVRIVTRSLELIRHCDHRRYKRVIKQTRWLMNCALAGGSYSGQYQHRIKGTQLDFEYDRSKGGMTLHAAFYAGVIVHEATHGLIRDRKINTKPANRVQIERICRAEENRFLQRMLEVFPSLPNSMIRPFNPDDWSDAWHASFFRRAWKLLTRSIRKN